MDSSDNITIISKEGDKIEIDRRIVDFCEGLAIYDLEEEIDLSKTLSTKCLNTLKDFYEKNDFDKEKLKVEEVVVSTDLKENLKTEQNFEIMESYYKEVCENKDLDELLDLQNGAELLRAQEFQNLITITLATIIYCPENEEEQQEYCKKWDIDENKPSEEVINEIKQIPELYQAWQEMDKQLCGTFKDKLKELLCPNGESDTEEENEDEEKEQQEGENNQQNNGESIEQE